MRIDPGSIGSTALTGMADQLAKVQWSQGVPAQSSAKNQTAVVIENSTQGILVQLGNATGLLAGLTGLKAGDAIPLQFQMGPEGAGWYAAAKAAPAISTIGETALPSASVAGDLGAQATASPEFQLLGQLLSQFANSSGAQADAGQMANLATLILGAEQNGSLASQPLASTTQVSPSLDAKQLQVLTERGGLFFESRIGQFARAELDGSPVREQEWRGLVSNDLKGRLLAENRSAGQSVGAAAPESASSALGQSILSNIEARQIRMGFDHASTGNLYLHVPLPKEGEPNASWLKMEIENHGDQAEGRARIEATRFRFSVNLENLGTMRVSGFASGEEVVLRVMTEKPQYLGAIEGALAEQFSNASLQGEKKVEFSVGAFESSGPAEQDHFTRLEGFLPTLGAGSVMDGKG